jgi:hypothetical protein
MPVPFSARVTVNPDVVSKEIAERSVSVNLTAGRSGVKAEDLRTDLEISPDPLLAHGLIEAGP